MSEESTIDKTVDSPNPNDAKTSESISKEDHNTEVKKLEDQLSASKNELNQKEMELLSPEYLKYRETLNTPTKEATPSTDRSKDPNVRTLEDKVMKLETTLDRTSKSLQDMAAYNELQDVRGRYSDFDSHREDIQTLLKSSSTELTYEQAYKIVKLDHTQAEAAKSADKPKSSGSSEKPTGSLPYKALDKKEYKNIAESDQATINSLRDKYPDLGDTI